MYLRLWVDYIFVWNIIIDYHPCHQLIHLFNDSINYLFPLYGFYCIQSNCTQALQASMSTAFSMSALLIFQMQLISSALFLNAKGLFFLLLLLVPVIVIVPLTTIYTLLKSDWSWASIYFLVINLGKSSDVVPNKFVIFWYSIFTRCQNSLTSSIICCLIPGGM